MKEYQYAIIVSHNNGGWEEINFHLQDDDEPVNIFCGNSDPNNDFLGEYFILHTLKGHVYLFQHSSSSNVNIINVCKENFYADHVACSYNCIFVSSKNTILFYSFNSQKAELTLEGTYSLSSPILSMKPASTNTIAIFVHLQDYSLKMIRKYHNELIDIESNVLLYDVSFNSILFIKNDLSRQIINYKFEPKGETSKSINFQKENDEKRVLPYHLYFHKYDSDSAFQCIEEIIPGELNYDNSTIKFSKLISRQNKLLFCDRECHRLSFWNDEPFFEIPDQIILFDQFGQFNDFLVIIRHASYEFTPLFLKPYDINIVLHYLDLVNTETAEMITPFSDFYDSNIFLESVLIFLHNIEANFNFLREKAQNFIQIINWIIDYQSSLIDTFLLSRILTYQFFKVFIDIFDLYFTEEICIYPVSISCLAILIDKAMKVASIKPSQKTFYLFRTTPEASRPVIPIIPPIRIQFNCIHHMTMDFIQEMPENFIVRTLSALLSCLKYTKCSVLALTQACFQFDVIQKIDENVYYLIKNLLIEGNTTKNENLPTLIHLLLHSYRFISFEEPNSDLLKKIRDFFEHKPQDLDSKTMSDIQNVFNEYMNKLKPKFQKFLDEIRFYPQKEIASEIQKFIKSYLPIPIIDTENKFRDNIEKLSKSGRLLRIKIEYINMIQDADDYITLCQVSNISRKKSGF